MTRIGSNVGLQKDLAVDLLSFHHTSRSVKSTRSTLRHFLWYHIGVHLALPSPSVNPGMNPSMKLPANSRPARPRKTPANNPSSSPVVDL